MSNGVAPHVFVRICQHLRDRAMQKHKEVEDWYEREMRTAESRLETWHEEWWGKKVPKTHSVITRPWRVAPLHLVRAAVFIRRTSRIARRLSRSLYDFCLPVLRTVASVGELRVTKPGDPVEPNQLRAGTRVTRSKRRQQE